MDAAALQRLSAKVFSSSVPRTVTGDAVDAFVSKPRVTYVVFLV